MIIICQPCTHSSVSTGAYNTIYYDYSTIWSSYLIIIILTKMILLPWKNPTTASAKQPFQLYLSALSPFPPCQRHHPLLSKGCISIKQWRPCKAWLGNLAALSLAGQKMAPLRNILQILTMTLRRDHTTPLTGLGSVFSSHQMSNRNTSAFVENMG